MREFGRFSKKEGGGVWEAVGFALYFSQSSPLKTSWSISAFCFRGCLWNAFQSAQVPLQQDNWRWRSCALLVALAGQCTNCRRAHLWRSSPCPRVDCHSCPLPSFQVSALGMGVLAGSSQGATGCLPLLQLALALDSSAPHTGARNIAGFQIHVFQDCCYISLTMNLFFSLREAYRDLWMVVTGLHDLTEQEYTQVLSVLPSTEIQINLAK